MGCDIPRLETARLVLRGHAIDDLAECAAMWGDERVTRHIGGRPFTKEEVWARLLRYVGHWSLMGFGFWAVIDKASGRFAGEAGFADFQRDVGPAFDGAPEAGWVIAPWAHGQGFATEAIRAATAWFDRERGRTRMVCMIDPENSGSIRVAGKCGFSGFGSTTYKGHEVRIFERT
jgi:RimJ/RimL family protein N-acetyltransferase